MTLRISTGSVNILFLTRGKRKNNYKDKNVRKKKEMSAFRYTNCCIPPLEEGSMGYEFTGFTEYFHKLCSHLTLIILMEKGFIASISHGANPMAGKRQKQDSHPFSAFLSRLSTITGSLRKDN